MVEKFNIEVHLDGEWKTVISMKTKKDIYRTSEDGAIKLLNNLKRRFPTGKFRIVSNRRSDEE
ncbi:hypothetical protein [Erysipelothrix anatis]|uniref:hypothetical protein n=1 Tax=Erysipelothrix anatis TaxID=2683713 RepID=UPI00135C1783|nr:hypothetical protein [Erysipelothrix anatis]